MTFENWPNDFEGNQKRPRSSISIVIERNHEIHLGNCRPTQSATFLDRSQRHSSGVSSPEFHHFAFFLSKHLCFPFELCGNHLEIKTFRCYGEMELCSQRKRCSSRLRFLPLARHPMRVCDSIQPVCALQSTRRSARQSALSIGFRSIQNAKGREGTPNRTLEI